jgi:hypothetical protein
MAENQVVGPQVLSNGANADFRADKTGASVVTDAHGRFQEAVLGGRVWLASTQAGQATSTGLSTTQTGFTLTNPAGSGVNLVLWQVCIAITTAPAAASTLVLAANVNTVAAAVTQTTPLTVRNALLGTSGTGNGLAASAVTLPAAPVVIRAIGGGCVGASTINTVPIVENIDGSIVLTPGTAVSVNSITTAVSAIISMVWEECAV